MVQQGKSSNKKKRRPAGKNSRKRKSSASSRRKKTNINIKMIEKYISPIQVFAIWLKKEYYTNAFDITTWIIDYFTKEIEINSEKAEIVKNSGDRRL